ncbi:MAG: nitrous oxide-stimulated promoter family protein [Candidatus Latescibacteria bacterium]|nr:nitrous oxide-stimulated promoter family protein [Candidatus Latescibacterota bacterium]MCK5732584.1 nitrous oxide-stimulated promoter family protein [Candidatus Latescibacterota bacterium]
MSTPHPRMFRENRTVEAMIRIYCHALHGTRDALCPDCDQLLLYAQERLNKCPFQETKTTCANCPTHCYREAPRKSIREVMRVAGPRMLYRHPFLALLHLIDGLRKEPLYAKGKSKN